jgi:PTS system N-acetylglucosamine-specific IIC component
MLPIAALPAAGLLLRLGQDDLLGAVPGCTRSPPSSPAAGGALFTNLPLIFAVGIAIGWARKADGSTALAAVVGYLVARRRVHRDEPDRPGRPGRPKGEQALVNYGVLGGIVVRVDLGGALAAVLPHEAARRARPSSAAAGSCRSSPRSPMIVVGVLLAWSTPCSTPASPPSGNAVNANPVVGGGVYGTANRSAAPGPAPHPQLGRVVHPR